MVMSLKLQSEGREARLVGCWACSLASREREQSEVYLDESGDQ